MGFAEVDKSPPIGRNTQKQRLQNSDHNLTKKKNKGKSKTLKIPPSSCLKEPPIARNTLYFHVYIRLQLLLLNEDVLPIAGQIRNHPLDDGSVPGCPSVLSPRKRLTSQIRYLIQTQKLQVIKITGIIVLGLINPKNIWSSKDCSGYRCASLSSCRSLSLSSHVRLSLSLHVSLSFFIWLSLHMSLCGACVVCGVLCCCVWWCVVCVACVVRFFLSCTEKRSRVYVQNAPVCTFKTPVSHKTRAF